jgi:hypothetical protein
LIEAAKEAARIIHTGKGEISVDDAARLCNKLDEAVKNAETECIKIEKYDFLCLAPGLTYGWGDTYAEAKKNCRSAYGGGWKAYSMYIVPPKAKYLDSGIITVPHGSFMPILVDEVKIKK